MALTLLSAGISVTLATAAGKATAPGQPTGVTAVGGLNSATVKWKTPIPNERRMITSYKITSFPDGKVHLCKLSVNSCRIAIDNPKENRTRKPKSLPYSFAVTAINGVGQSPASIRSASVIIRFRASVNFSNTFRVPNSAPKPTPTPVPSSTPSVATVTAFDGTYEGSAVVTITQTMPTTASATSTIPTSFKVINGRGAGGAADWVVEGYVTDASGTATVTASHPLYGSLTFAVNFVFNATTRVMSGTGTGTNTFSIPGYGSVTVNFVFDIATR